MGDYWRNGSGYADPTPAKVMRKEMDRNKEVRNTIKEIKSLCKSRNLKVLNRMIIKDEESGKVYK